MKRLLYFLFLLFMLMSPAWAGTRSCTTAMVNLNICRTTADVAYCLAIGTADPDGAGPLQAPSTLVADAFASLGNWQSPAPCTAEIVAAGICSSGQIGTSVAITKAQFADLQIRDYVMTTVRRYLKQQKMAAAQAAADAAVDPDFGQ